MNKLNISEKANPNYLAKVVELKGIRKHGNADRLQVVSIDFQNVILGNDYKDGDICVFFPLECVINLEFLKDTNSFRHANLNKIVNDDAKGFFDDNGRVKAIKLRGEKSMGVIFPVSTIQEFTGYDLSDCVGKEFDMIGDKLMLKKYQVKEVKLNNGREGSKPKASRLIEGIVKLHVDTENLRKNAWKLELDDNISITYKVHGTSWWVGNLPVKRPLNLLERLIKKIGFKINDIEYDYVYGSRKVVKNKNVDDGKSKEHYYEYDLWGDIKEEVKSVIPKNFTLYGECVGYTKGGSFIQGNYDYGCEVGQKKLYIYRITVTNIDGTTIDLSTKQVYDFCSKTGLSYVPLFYSGKVCDFPDLDKDNLLTTFIPLLESKYNDKDCYLCVNKVPEEGIVLRKENLGFESYKLKSFSFLEYESKVLDSGVEDMESVN